MQTKSWIQAFAFIAAIAYLTGCASTAEVAPAPAPPSAVPIDAAHLVGIWSNRLSGNGTVARTYFVIREDGSFGIVTKATYNYKSQWVTIAGTWSLDGTRLTTTPKKVSRRDVKVEFYDAPITSLTATTLSFNKATDSTGTFQRQSTIPKEFATSFYPGDGSDDSAASSPTH